MNMNTKSSHLGALVGAAGISALVVVAWPNAPGSLQPVPLQAAPLLSDGTLGRALLEFIAAGIILGVLGVGLKLGVARLLQRRPAELRELPARSAPAASVVVAFPRPADATASQFDEVGRRAFVPIASLTEAQVRRRRALGVRRRAVPKSA